MTEPALDKSFSSSERLFHYTSAEGLYGILSNDCLWASHYQFLNDKQEFIVARNFLVNFIGKTLHANVAAHKVNGNIQLPPNVKLRDICYEQSERAVGVLYEAALKLWEPYVFATFCSSPSDGREFTDGTLQHWSYYAQQSGYALQFNPHRLSALMREEVKDNKSGAWSLEKVQYLTEGMVPQSLSQKFSDVANYCVALITNKNDVSDEVKNKGVGSFLDCISHSKDSYFNSEREARLVIFRSVKQNMSSHEVCIRTNARGISIPYIRILDGKLLGQDSPLEKIILGPHPSNKDRMIALRIYLKSKGLDVELAESGVPFTPK